MTHHIQLTFKAELLYFEAPCIQKHVLVHLHMFMLPRVCFHQQYIKISLHLNQYNTEVYDDTIILDIVNKLGGNVHIHITVFVILPGNLTSHANSKS